MSDTSEVLLQPHSINRAQLCTLNTGAGNSFRFLSFLSDNVISILLNSGATHSFIAKHTISNYSLPLSELSASLPLHTVSTESKPSQWITHSTKWDVKLPNFPIFKWEFLIIDAIDTEDIILGYDFLKAWNPVIDWVQETIVPRDLALASNFTELESVPLQTLTKGTKDLPEVTSASDSTLVQPPSI